MSKLLDKQVNAKKRKSSGVQVSSRKLPQAHEKVCDEKMKEEKNDTRVKIIFMDGSPLAITLILRNYESDLLEPQGNDYEYNEGTIC